MDLRKHISVASNLFSSSFARVQFSQPLTKPGHMQQVKIRVVMFNFLFVRIFVRFMEQLLAHAILGLISILHLPSWTRDTYSFTFV